MLPSDGPSSPPPGIRIDLHCHSVASNRPTEAVLRALNCPECYSEPEALYAQAKHRGMGMVTITDHDCIDGALTISARQDVIVGEELTCWFPEDQCKMHVVVWGLTRDDHDALQSRSKDIYAVAEYLEEKRLAHAVAHPIYRQNDKLERWHIERLMLLFKGFECLNGAHSPLHREAFEPLLDQLTEQEIHRLSERHRLRPHWLAPHVKARTAGSDDHGLLNVGKTWTEFPLDTKTRDDVLRCLREGRCSPGGESGSATKLAHTFYSVAVRYYGRHILAPTSSAPNLPTLMLQLLVGERDLPTKRDLAKLTVRGKLRKWLAAITPPILQREKPNGGVRPIRDLFAESVKQRIREHPALLASLKDHLPPLGEHDEMFRFVSDVNRDVTEQIAEAITQSIDAASFTGLFNSIASVLAQQFVLSPYYFALFHQNKERALLRRLTGYDRAATPDCLRVGLFTDTFDEINGVSRFLRNLGAFARNRQYHLTIHTCTPDPQANCDARKNFLPLLTRPLPCYEELKLHLPPVIEILDFVDKQQYDVIHVSTPGPMGLLGYVASRMLRVPLLGTYHTDFPAYCEELTRDHRIARGANVYMQWLYSHMDRVFARSREYQSSLSRFGLPDERLSLIAPCVDTKTFNPNRADPNLWGKLGVTQPFRLLYAGRLSAEKNLAFLSSLFRTLCRTRNDVALILAGDGPYRATMEDALKGLPAHFLGYQSDAALSPLYASSDLFLFPSRTDTLGQVVLEAQASGLPCLVSDEGGPKEIIDDGATGIVLGTDEGAWSAAIELLLDDEPRRKRMSIAASQSAHRPTPEQSFEAFWTDHLAAAAASNREQPLHEPSDLPFPPRRGKGESVSQYESISQR